MDSYSIPQKLLKILIVDEQLISVEDLRYHSASNAPFLYYKADNEQLGLDLIERVSPEIIIVNTTMVGSNCFEFCSSVRKSRKQGNEVIILVASNSTQIDLQKAYKHGADDCLINPDAMIIAKKLEMYSHLNRWKEIEQQKKLILNVFNHETRNPLNSIILANEMVVKEAGLQSKIGEYATIIGTSAGKLKKLLNSISTYCTVKEGLHRSPVSGNFQNSFNVDENRELIDFQGKIEFSGDNEIEFTADWELLISAVKGILDYAVDNRTTDAPVSISEYERNSIWVIEMEYSVAEKPQNTEDSWPNNLHYPTKCNLDLEIAKEIITAHGGNIYYLQKENGKAIITIELI